MQRLNLFTYFFRKDHFTVLRWVCVVIVLSMGTIGTAFAQEAPEKVKLDAVVKDFTLKDAEGTDFSLYKLSEEKQVTVVLFLATQCPVATDYTARIVNLVKAYDAKKVQFIGINSNKQEKIAEILAYSKKHGFEFPVLKDRENKIADYFGARRTPEVFLLDAKRVLRYAGAIDNSRKEPTKHYLKDALDLVIAGKDIPKPSKKTRAIGCTIKRVRKTGVNDRTP
ncbi:redoxin domain-containing protein [Candidatus Poribacteria bacterium]|nr:redoxin domain-containing protein [Candidatus Poribacteria bacterium]MYK96019.1 redoxin domain-containing protein [Candidatus Poribacteria bacterium]